MDIFVVLFLFFCFRLEQTDSIQAWFWQHTFVSQHSSRNVRWTSFLNTYDHRITDQLHWKGLWSWNILRKISAEIMRYGYHFQFICKICIILSTSSLSPVSMHCVDLSSWFILNHSNENERSGYSWLVLHSSLPFVFTIFITSPCFNFFLPCSLSILYILSSIFSLSLFHLFLTFSSLCY